MAAIYYFHPKNIEFPVISTGQEAKNILGGKGAALVDMTRAGYNVPAGFTLTTTTCHEYNDAPDKFAYMHDRMSDVMEFYTRLHADTGYAPLVSVRSGAPVSMPGMMDTILNVGLTSETLPLWVEKIGEWAALDSYRRLIQMMGGTAFNMNSQGFEDILADARKIFGVKTDAELTVDALNDIIVSFKHLFSNETGKDFPDDVQTQLKFAIEAVFKSWMNPRAIHYRKMNNIPESMGTAVTVQRMVFGNAGNDSCSGVVFTRNASTGENLVMGEFLVNAQGEDVVAGVRTPLPLHEMPLMEYDTEEKGSFEAGENMWAKIHDEITAVCDQLEAEYNDMVDIEFTVESGELYILQSRVGKRSALAAVRIAHDLYSKKDIDLPTALSRVSIEQYKTLRRPVIDPEFKEKASLTGLPACVGIAIGKPVFSVDEAVACPEPCILISHETTPDDIVGMQKAVGILTSTGGATSHAAVVARAMDKPCVVGATALNIAELISNPPEYVSIDGATGQVWLGHAVPTIDSSKNPYVEWFIRQFVSSTAVIHSNHPTKEHMHYCITPQAWWGNSYVLNVVMDALNKIEGTLAGIHILMPNPLRFMPIEDDPIFTMFGKEGMDTDPDFLTEIKNHPLIEALVERGLNLVFQDDIEKVSLVPSIDHAVMSGMLVLKS